MPKEDKTVIIVLALILLAFAVGFYLRGMFSIYLNGTPSCNDVGGMAFSNELMLWRDMYPGRWIPNDMANPYIHINTYPNPSWNFGNNIAQYHYQIAYFLIDGAVRIIEGDCHR
jgi:hypothetical protein